MPLRAPMKVSQTLSRRNLKRLKSSRPDYQIAPVVVAISHKNQPELLQRALRSAVNQTLVVERKAQIVILDDGYSVGYKDITGLILEHPAITILSANCGSPSRSRNQLLDWADRQPQVQWVARLDADDEFASANSLAALYLQAEYENAIAAIGSNGLRIDGSLSSTTNVASPEELLAPEALVRLITSFCIEGQSRELPSCNLLLKTGLGLRYPNIRSAEDHWLLMRLLFDNPRKVCVVTDPLYSIYSLTGSDTHSNQISGYWVDSRKKLAYVAQTLLRLTKLGYSILGYGLEGVVWLDNGMVYKEFYPWSLSEEAITDVQCLLSKAKAPVPVVTWMKTLDGNWAYQTPAIDYSAVRQYLPVGTIEIFLYSLYNAGIATLNIKRENLRLTPSQKLHYIDIGKDIQSLTTSYFLDMCARLYGIGIMGYDDEELLRRSSTMRPDEALAEIPGFSGFYLDLICRLHPENQLEPVASLANRTAHDVTLMIKCCAQDAQGLYEQVAHIVSQLSFPVGFAQTVLLVDDYEGPFLRQYAQPDLQWLLKQADDLTAEGLIHEVWIPPKERQSIKETYEQWFGTRHSVHTHTASNAPLYPQIWAFSNLQSRYVLQCDCDVLVGRKDLHHDYLTDILEAISPSDVLSIGFNIPKSTNEFLGYSGKPGEFPPEVRFGLLDLERIRECLPIDNPTENGRHQLTWHRAIQQYQKESQVYRSLRGGDPASFYIHPRNKDKSQLKNGQIRDLLAQGWYPLQQNENFDLVPEGLWQYPKRNEPVIFLVKGRHTPSSKLRRCIKSLEQQTCQDFGVILIDDASGHAHSWHYPLQMACFNERYTLIRNAERQGHISNMQRAINDVCVNSESLFVILDQDDFLMQNTVVHQLLEARVRGHDLIQMPMFRPNKPLKLYQPDYTAPRRKGGGNTWTHMRAFTKALFNSVPQRHLKKSDGHWFDSVTDYATMLPMAELSDSPVYLDTGYAYWHEREAYSANHKEREEKLLSEILTKPSLERRDCCTNANM